LSRLSRLTILLALALTAFVPAAASAAPAEITQAEARDALEAATAALAPAQPLAAGSGASGAPADATLALRDLAIAVPALSGAERRRANDLLARPDDKNDRGYFGPEAPDSPVCSEHFCVHFTNKAKNAPDSPEFLNEVVLATEQSYAIENGDDALDWRDAKSDGTRGARNGKGGNGQVDVYITNLPPDLYGYAAPDRGQKGAQRFAYLVLDNDYTNFPTGPLESMRVTVAHEYNHILQFGYDTFLDLWMFESSATWAEEQVYPEINDYLNYVPIVARYPQLPLTGRDKIYGEAVWNHWLTFRFGTAVVRGAWEAGTASKPDDFAADAYNRSIVRYGGESFSREFANFAIETAEWKSSDAFPDAALYPDMKRKLKVGPKSSLIFLDNTSYALADVAPSGAAPVKLTVKADSGTESAIALVGRTGGIEDGTVTVASKYLEKGGRSTVVLNDPASFERVTALVINSDARLGARGYLKDGSKYKVKLTK